MKKKSPNPRAARATAISDAEWTVMKVVWSAEPVTANDVAAALAGSVHWKAKTIQTLLTRLVKKGVLTFTKLGRQHLFRARLKEPECVRAASRSFLGRVFDGRVAPFLAHLIEQEELTPAEIDELTQILNNKTS